MKFSCPACAKVLSVPDEAAGKRVKCPGCAQIARVPPSQAIAAAPPRAVRPAPPPVPEARSAPPSRKQRRACPECGERMDPDAEECAECGWSAAERRRKPAGQARSGHDDEAGECHVQIRRDDVNLTEAIEKHLEKLFKTEQLDCALMDEDEDPPRDLGPNDLVITGKVTECDYGSQMMRYFLTFVTLFGPGACRLVVQALVETQDGERRLLARARQGIGILGGSGTGLMKVNVKTVSKRIAYDALRHLTGVSFLNAQAYHCGAWSLGLGFGALIPFVGIPLGLIGLVTGLIALVTIFRRQLPAGRWTALSGTILSLVGLLGNVILILLASRH